MGQDNKKTKSNSPKSVVVDVVMVCMRKVVSVFTHEQNDPLSSRIIRGIGPVPELLPPGECPTNETNDTKSG